MIYVLYSLHFRVDLHFLIIFRAFPRKRLFFFNKIMKLMFTFYYATSSMNGIRWTKKVHHLSNPFKLVFCKFWKLLDLHSFNRCILYYFCLPYDHSNQLSAVNIIGTWSRYTGDRLDLHGGTLGARLLWAPRPRVRRDQGAVGARALAEADRGRPHHHGLLSLHIRHLLRRVLPLLLRCVLGPVLGTCV